MYTVVGSPVSPFVQKVLLALELSELPYQVDPVSPFDPVGRERLLMLNPKGKIPVLTGGDLAKALPDSAEICKYLHTQIGGELLYPQEPAALQAAIDTERWADQTLGTAFGLNFFRERVLKPLAKKEPPDQQAVNKSLNELIPASLAELAARLPAEDFLFGSQPQVPDLTIGTWLRLGQISGALLSEDQYPQLVSYLRRLYQKPFYQRVIQLNNQQRSVQWARSEYLNGREIIE